jgi:Predicted nucleic-acid-binding protein, contains PIN domain
MNGKTFIDTNVLIYAHDIDASAKHQIAKTVLRGLWNERTGALSVQVLQDFYVNVTRKISSPLSKDLARRVVSSYAIWCTKTTPAEIASAFRIEDESRIGLGCLDRFVCLAMRRDSDFVGRLKRWATDCRYCYRESLCRHPLKRRLGEESTAFSASMSKACCATIFFSRPFSSPRAFTVALRSLPAHHISSSSDKTSPRSRLAADTAHR